MMTGHKSLEMVLRYDHHRESLELNAVNFLDYAEEPTKPPVGQGTKEEKGSNRQSGKNKGRKSD